MITKETKPRGLIDKYAELVDIMQAGLESKAKEIEKLKIDLEKCRRKLKP